MKDEHRLRVVLLRKGLVRIWPLLLALGAAVSVSGCAAIAWVAPLYGRVNNLSDEACSQSFSKEVASALQEQGETPEAATAAAERTLSQLSPEAAPLRFEAASGSGVSYAFFLEPRKSGQCVLRLYGRQKGRTTDENTFNYFATRRLSACSCDWVVTNYE